MTSFLLNRQVKGDIAAAVVSRSFFSSVMIFLSCFLPVIILGLFSFLSQNNTTASSGIIIFEYNMQISIILTASLTVLSNLISVEMKNRHKEALITVLMSLMLIVCMAVSLILSGIFYYSYKEISGMEALLSFINFILCAMLWVVLSFLPAVKNGKKIFFSFILFFVLLVSVLGNMYHVLESNGFLLGLNIGISFFVFTICAVEVKETAFTVKDISIVYKQAVNYLVVSLVPFFLALGMFADKLLLRNPWNDINSSRLDSYESVSFLSYVSLVPMIIIEMFFLLYIFPKRYRKFLRIIKENGLLISVKKAEKKILRFLVDFFGSALIFQGIIAVVCILSVSWIMTFAGNDAMIDADVFQYGTLSNYLFVMTLFLFVLFAFFDLLKPLFITSLIYAVTSFMANWFCIYDFAIYNGIGTLIASAITFVIAFIWIATYSGKIAYLTFRNYAGRL